LSNLDSKKLTLGLVSDKKYLKHVFNLLRSLDFHHNSVRVSICLLNIPNPDLVSNKIKSIYKNIELSFFDYEQQYSQKETKALAANHRVFFVNDLLERGYQKIFYLDCDSIVRGDIVNEISKLENSDISIIFRHFADERSKVAAGAILFRNNPATKEFIAEWEKKIEPIKNCWFSDQITFYETYLEKNNTVSFSNLAPEMNDWTFKDTSIIWSGKGDRKKENLIYLLELLSYNFKSPIIRACVLKIQELLRKFNLYQEI